MVPCIITLIKSDPVNVSLELSKLCINDKSVEMEQYAEKLTG